MNRNRHCFLSLQTTGCRSLPHRFKMIKRFGFTIGKCEMLAANGGYSMYVPLGTGLFTEKCHESHAGYYVDLLNAQ